MVTFRHALVVAWMIALPPAAAAQENAAVSPRFRALQCPSLSLGRTWDIRDRDGANRRTEPYLSSLAQGESGVGMITSPPFLIDVDEITVAVCGHDGRQGGRNENYLAVVDARKGEVLRKVPAPQDDAMQERKLNVKRLRGAQVRIELRDGNGDGAFAWLGVGRIDAGPGMRIDFRQGMPKGWAETQGKAEVRYEVLTGGVPFQRVANAFTLIPRQGAVEIACGFNASGLYFLGCTAGGVKPLDICGGIEIHYKTGSPDVFPLMGGFTLDDYGKLLSPSKALCLHPSADPYQYYLPIRPRAEVIEKIRLVAAGNGMMPRITAVTCETAANADSLMPLPDVQPDAKEAAWIDSHAISAGKLDLKAVTDAVRAAHKMPAP